MAELGTGPTAGPSHNAPLLRGACLGVDSRKGRVDKGVLEPGGVEVMTNPGLKSTDLARRLD